MDSSRFPASVQLTEVGLRDGLQNESRFIPAEQKIALAEKLIEAGLRSFEISSFVSPRAVPQLADASNVVAGLRHHEGIELKALVPNRKGAERAIQSGVDAMVVFLSASESHNLKNVNCTRAKSLSAVREIAEVSRGTDVALHAAIATAFGCPFEGAVAVETVRDIALRLRDSGVSSISLGDTTGMATPPLVEEWCTMLQRDVPDVDVALHFHNTRGVGLVCVYAGLQAGVMRYEASVGGLGGCPFVPDATGNVCTEDLVYLLDELGIATGVDLSCAVEAARLAESTVGHPLPGQVMKAGPRLRRYALDNAATAKG